MIALAFLASARFLASPPQGYERITPQVAAERVQRCGTSKVTIRSDAELDSDVLVIAVEGPITEKRLACIDKAAGFYDVEVPPTAQPRFNAMRDARTAAWMAAESKRWLATQGLLDRLPTYKPGVTIDATFAREVETLCNARGALSSKYGVHALSPQWAMQRSEGLPDEDRPMSCLLSATWATGYKLNFIGNAKIGR